MTRPRLVHALAASAMGLALLWGSSAASVQASALPAPSTLNPCAAKTLNPCAAKTLNPCAAKTLNPCAAKTLNAAAARTLNPCAAKTLNPCAAKTLNPCAAKTLNPCAAKTLNAAAARTLNPCAAKTLNPCLARKLNPCAAKTLNPCAAKHSSGDGASLLDPRTARHLVTQLEVKPRSMIRTVAAHSNPCNPCAMKRNPCNPCAMKHNPCNPCGAKGNPCNPCGMRNPCNPCGGAARINPCQFKRPTGLSLVRASQKDLVAEGEKLWNDRSLGRSGLACANCHIQNYMQMNPTFGKPYPHYVEMVQQRSGIDEVSADEMVQFCMMAPMASKPLGWHSRELAALTAYVEHIHPGYHPVGGAGANPCNPCGMKHNPCNPCGMKHNPCNPCSKKM
ncbi:MAG: hypothetical protein ACE5IL_01690 [Myxococcota bacterium]